VGAVPLEETWGAMAELVEQGSFGQSVSRISRLDDGERCHAQRRVDAIQDGLNLLDYFDNREPFARYGDLDIAVTVFDSLSAGVLTDRTREQVLTAWETYSAHGWSHPLLEPGKIEATYPVVDALRPIAQRHQATVAQIAIAWIRSQRE
jgi:aryl-alcohol dehydrogenase-like predicted oxidoreductase